MTAAPRGPAAPDAGVATPAACVRPCAARWIALAVGVAAFVLYGALAPDAPGDRDAAELSLVLATNGVAHPTGYPLFTPAGHVFVSAARGLGASWALAANLWSALGGGAACAALFALALRLVTWVADGAGRRTAVALALVPVALLLLDPAWTAETTVAEVHSWHVAWACVAALHACGTIRLVAAGDVPPGSLLRRAAAWGLVCGVGAAHHVTSVLTSAALTAAVVAALARARRLRTSHVAAGAACALLPLAAYGIVAWRAFHPAAVQWEQLGPTWASVADHVTGDQYHGWLGGFAPSAIQRELLGAGIYPFLAVGVVAVCVAAVRAAAPGARLALLGLLGAGALVTAKAFAYAVPDPASYFLVPVAFGLAALAPAIAAIFAAPRLRAAGAAAGLVVAACLAPGWGRTAAERGACFVEYERMIRGIWASVPFDEGFVLWPSDMAARLRAYQLLLGERPRVAVVNPLALGGGTARAAFTARHGFDPLADVAWPADGTAMDTSSAEFLAAVESGIARQARLAVVVVDPAAGSLRLPARRPARIPARPATPRR